MFNINIFANPHFVERKHFQPSLHFQQNTFMQHSQIQTLFLGDSVAYLMHSKAGKIMLVVYPDGSNVSSVWV